MNIRLTPRGLNALKTLAGELGMRPGELVTKWVEERLEAERAGGATPEVRTALEARVEELANRVAALEMSRATRSGRSEPQAPAQVTPAPETAAPAPAGEAAPETTAMPRRRGRPPKSATATATAETGAPAAARGRPRKGVAAKASGKRVPLHEEIIAVIGERGPMTAADLATAITERGVFQPPRSGKPLDAATVNSRVSNPVYRSRFRRDGHQIRLAED